MATHKLILTREEMENIVRGYFDARPDTVVEIEDNDEDEDEVPWISLYANWRGGRPPYTHQFNMIDVMFRNGTIDRAHPGNWNDCWNQDGSPYDIIKYRPVK